MDKLMQVFPIFFLCEEMTDRSNKRTNEVEPFQSLKKSVL